MLLLWRRNFLRWCENTFSPRIVIFLHFTSGSVIRCPTGIAELCFNLRFVSLISKLVIIATLNKQLRVWCGACDRRLCSGCTCEFACIFEAAAAHTHLSPQFNNVYTEKFIQPSLHNQYCCYSNYRHIVCGLFNKQTLYLNRLPWWKFCFLLIRGRWRWST